MIWKSVVGKLWMTIIGLVALVLIALSLFLSQFFDRFYYNQELKNLIRLADAVNQALNKTNDYSSALRSVTQLVEGENRKLFILNIQGKQFIPSPIKEIISDPRFNPSMEGQQVSFRGFFPVERDGEIRSEDLLVIVLPMELLNERKMIIIYESLNAVTETIEGTKSLILYAAGLGILLTTFFAFFLSSRVTRPLIQMKETADRIANGDFSSRVVIRSHDEIGELGSTLNHMAGQLEETVHLLSTEKEKISSILKSMADGVISVDLNMEIKITNPHAEHFFSYWNFGSNTLPTVFVSLFQECINNNEEVSRDIEIMGTILSVVVSPLYDRQFINGAVAVFRDVTTERKLDRLRKDFVANISHELRTPIAMLQGYSEAILDGIASSESEQRELVEIIFDESVRMNKLVNELLDFARMEAGHLQINPVKINFNTLLNKIGKKFNTIAKDSNIRLIIENQLKDDLVYLDMDRMEQVFTNLIDNALRHTSPGGEIKIVVYKKEKLLVIEISDTGSGITEEDLAFLFERFYKGDKARTRGRAGTGLGLAIVKHIVEAHKGHIYVESKLGVGTTFTIHMQQADYL